MRRRSRAWRARSCGTSSRCSAPCAPPACRFTRQRPGRYAQQLRALLRTAEPGRKLDLLLVGALIEARSAERFSLLAPRLPAPLARFYGDLGTSEARHFELYVGFARAAAADEWRRGWRCWPRAKRSWRRRPKACCAFIPGRRRVRA